MPPERIDAAVERVLAELRPRVRAALEAELARVSETSSDDLLDQHASPAGPRVHIRIARALLERGAAGVTRAGRRWLLTRAALTAELEAMGRARAAMEARAQSCAEGPAAELRRELDLLHGGRR
jgi:hypothetical protein